jgi:pimeloyl-ACP methyl ester carboxylesterase
MEVSFGWLSATTPACAISPSNDDWRTRVDAAIEHWVPVEGTELFVREVGDGPTLLFIHGMCGDADVWLDQQQRLSEGYRCVAYDRRGHTRSPFGTGIRTVEAHADDAAALIDGLGLAPVVIVGSSGGARIGLDMTRRFAPRLRGAVLSEPALIPLSADGGKSFIARVGPALGAAATPQAAVDAFFMQVDPHLWTRLPDERKDAYRANHVELFGDLEMPTYAPTDDELAAITVPTRFLVGAESEPVFGEIVRRVAAIVPGATVTVLEGATHATYASAPEGFAEVVRGFASPRSVP